MGNAPVLETLLVDASNTQGLLWKRLGADSLVMTTKNHAFYADQGTRISVIKTDLPGFSIMA